MEEFLISARTRDVIGKQVKALRREGRLPAVIYGHNLDPIAIDLDTREATRILAGMTSSQFVNIEVDGTSHTALIREKQRHPVRGNLLHVDFLAVSMTETLRASVSIELIGEAPAAREYGALVVPSVEMIEVECLPKDLPDRIRVDLSGLVEIGDTIYVRDIDLPDEVSILTDPDEVLVSVTAPAMEEEEEEEEELEEEELEPEVIERGKREEEEEEES
ncbi:MAG: 50S ribosomal protein L25 [Anaerolineales bacterium]